MPVLASIAGKDIPLEKFPYPNLCKLGEVTRGTFMSYSEYAQFALIELPEEGTSKTIVKLPLIDIDGGLVTGKTPTLTG